MFTSNLKNSVSFSSIILPSQTHTHTHTHTRPCFDESVIVLLPFNCVNTDCGRKKRVCERSFALRPKLSLSFILHAVSPTFTRRRLCYGATWTVAGSIKTPVWITLLAARCGPGLFEIQWKEQLFWDTLTRNKRKSCSRQKEKKGFLVECFVIGTGLNICRFNSAAGQYSNIILPKMEASHYL